LKRLLLDSGSNTDIVSPFQSLIDHFPPSQKVGAGNPHAQTDTRTEIIREISQATPAVAGIGHNNLQLLTHRPTSIGASALQAEGLRLGSFPRRRLEKEEPSHMTKRQRKEESWELM
jgi:hypothetical protein